MARGSNTRAALLTAAMHLVPASPVDIFRFLHVPAIVMTIRRVRGRICAGTHAHPAPQRRSRWRAAH